MHCFWAIYDEIAKTTITLRKRIGTFAAKPVITIEYNEQLLADFPLLLYILFLFHTFLFRLYG